MYKAFEEKTTGSEKKVMLAILKLMAKDLNVITIGGKTLLEIMDETGMSESHIRNSVSKLKSLFLIEPTGVLRGEYIVNPTFAIKGDIRKVWRFYGELENKTRRLKDKITASNPFVGGVDLSKNEELPLLEED